MGHPPVMTDEEPTCHVVEDINHQTKNQPSALPSANLLHNQIPSLTKVQADLY